MSLAVPARAAVVTLATASDVAASGFCFNTMP
jgi:hypothetical protein